MIKINLLKSKIKRGPMKGLKHFVGQLYLSYNEKTNIDTWKDLATGRVYKLPAKDTTSMAAK